MNIVVSGYFVGFPMAGLFWHAASFAVGFADAGHDVWYVEDAGDYPSSFDFDRMDDDAEAAFGIKRLSEGMARIGLGDRWAYRQVPFGRVHGLDDETLGQVLAEADVFVDVSMTTTMRPEYRRIPHRIGIDTDPVFTQVRVRHDPETADRYTRLFTFGRPPLPAARPEDEWVPTRQAVAARHWDVAPPPGPDAPFTTVTSWSAYPGVTWEGRRYDPKGTSLRAFADLPARTSVPMAMVLGGGGEQANEVLGGGGWTLLDPFGRSVELDDYNAFIRSSAGEIGFAKHGYVASRSGWFSDRTCCYLARGRAAVCQETGWSDWLATGEGLFSFTTPAEAVRALEEVAADPVRHARAARRLVVEEFDAATVCRALLDRL